MAGEKDAQRARGGETKTPLRRAARPLELLAVEPHPPLSRGWHRALASGPVAGSASYTLRSGCDVCLYDISTRVFVTRPRASGDQPERRDSCEIQVSVARRR